MRKSEIKVLGMKIFMAILLMILTGCASNYKDFKVSDVDDDEGVVIGKVNVVYNNDPYNTDLCEFCIGSTCHGLLKEGYVFMPLIRNEDHSSMSLFCHYIGGQGNSTHIFEINSLEINPGVTYIGNFIFSATEVSSDQLTPGMVLVKATHSGRRAMLGIVGSLFLPEQKASLQVGAVVSVKDDISSVLSAYQQQVENGSAQAEKNIVSVGAQAEKNIVSVGAQAEKNIVSVGAQAER